MRLTRQLLDRVLAFGRGVECQTGCGIPMGHHEALEVAIEGGATPITVCAGLYSSAVLAADGSAWVFGSNKHGQLGVGPKVATVDVGMQFRCRDQGKGAQGAANRPATVGRPGAVVAHGQAGARGASSSTAASQEPRGPAAPIRQLVLGQEHAAAVTTIGHLYTCGQAREGQLGTGGAMGPVGSYHGGQQADCLHWPTRVHEPFEELGDSVKMVAVSRYFSLILGKSGHVYATGSEFHGALGVGHTPYCTSPCLVLGLPDPKEDPVVRIAAGLSFSLAVTASGRLYFWGSVGHGGAAGTVGGQAAKSQPSSTACAAANGNSGTPGQTGALRSRTPMEVHLPGWEPAPVCGRCDPGPGGSTAVDTKPCDCGPHVAVPGVAHRPAAGDKPCCPGERLQIAAGLHHAMVTDGRRLWALGLDSFGATGQAASDATGAQTHLLGPRLVEVLGGTVTVPPDSRGAGEPSPASSVVQSGPAHSHSGRSVAHEPAVRIQALSCGPYTTSVIVNGRLYISGRLESPYLLGSVLGEAAAAWLEGRAYEGLEMGQAGTDSSHASAGGSTGASGGAHTARQLPLVSYEAAMAMACEHTGCRTDAASKAAAPSPAGKTDRAGNGHAERVHTPAGIAQTLRALGLRLGQAGPLAGMSIQATGPSGAPYGGAPDGAAYRQHASSGAPFLIAEHFVPVLEPELYGRPGSGDTCRPGPQETVPVGHTGKPAPGSVGSEVPVAVALGAAHAVVLTRTVAGSMR